MERGGNSPRSFRRPEEYAAGHPAASLALVLLAAEGIALGVVLGAGRTSDRLLGFRRALDAFGRDAGEAAVLGSLALQHPVGRARRLRCRWWRWWRWRRSLC